MIGYVGKIEATTLGNSNFRQVIFTGQHQQLVLMTLPPGEEIGMEIHSDTDQFFRFESGQGKVVLNGEESLVSDGDAVLVPAGTNHNVVNLSQTEPLKLYTIYSPPHHPEGTIHQSKAEALAAEHS